MRSFARWVTSRPFTLVLLSIVFVQIVPPVAAALGVLDALRRGPAAAMTSALMALAAIAVIGVALGIGLVEALSVSAPILFGGVAVGALLGWSRNLSFAYQSTVIGSIVLALIIFTVVPGVDRVGEYLLSETMLVLESVGLAEEQLIQFAATPTSLLVQFLLTSLLLTLLAALMLGYWWYSLIEEGVRFGEDFRALKLGRFAGMVLLLLFALRLVVTAELIQNVAQLAVVGFLFQGLAVMHARSHSGNWHGATIVVVYVAIFSFSSLAVIAIAGLSVIGLLDNFFALRARIEPRI
jgi:hypothetical protein